MNMGLILILLLSLFVSGIVIGIFGLLILHNEWIYFGCTLGVAFSYYATFIILTGQKEEKVKK